MADAVTVLRQEIATLEQEISKRRKALAVLTGSTVPMKSPTPLRPTPPPPLATPGGLPLSVRILAYLAANKGKLFAPVQIAKTLAETDKSVKGGNVQRRLGELFKRKKVKRENGRYGAA